MGTTRTEITLTVVNMAADTSSKVAITNTDAEDVDMVEVDADMDAYVVVVEVTVESRTKK